tara:strand:- start:2258 stop:3535 length:1278 start_codon:yes stop_codon:yes gene_type:complete
MADQEKIKNLFSFEKIASITSGKPDYPDWFDEFKRLSTKNLMDQNLPSIKDSEWESTKINSLTKKLFNDDFNFSHSANDLIVGDTKKDPNKITISFSNGIYMCSEELPSHIKILSHIKDKDKFRDLLDIKKENNSSFSSTLNSIILSDLLLIETSSNQKVDTLIHIINHASNQANLAPRIEIRASTNSSVKILEEVRASNDSIMNHVLRVNCQKNANIEFYKVIQRQENSHYLGTQDIEASENARIKFFLWDFGGDTSKTVTDTKLLGKKSEINYSALFTPNKYLHSGNQIKINHEASHTKSKIKVRGVLNDHSSGVFYGKIKVKESVTKTSAFMENKNLLLSDDASISSKPILEIYNDDTECSHSATSGSIDKEKLFYLKTRGIDEVEAKSFLVNSFIEEISGEITNKKIQDVFKKYLVQSGQL